MKLQHEQIQYVEFVSRDLRAAKQFYIDAFGWIFTDYPRAETSVQAGEVAYTAFTGDYVNGGFTLGEPQRGTVLLILYSERLEGTREKVQKAGGLIVKDIFDFPGGRRFHFTDPDGNELAVWSNT